ncbi:MAG: glycoside hydrolase family 2 TIM barrel-domain containing protein [Promethearchaeota archaeon]
MKKNVNIELNGKWFFFIDESDNGIKNEWYSPKWFQDNKDNKETGEIIQVPSNYNTLKGLDKYNGIVWYFLELPNIPYRPLSHEYSIEFDGSNYITDVWINGHNLGTHEGGSIPFRLEFSPRILSLRTTNYLAVRINPSLQKDGLPSNRCQLFNWGGIFRDVRIILLEKTRVYKIKVNTEFKNKKLDSALIKLEYSIKNPQEYLDRCYLEQIEPEIEYEIYYLGHFFAGSSQYNKTLIQTGAQYINPEPSPPLKHISHDIKEIEKYFADISESHQNLEDKIDSEPIFTQYSTEQNSNLENIENYSKLNQSEDKIEEINNIVEPKNEIVDLNNLFSITMQNPSLWSPESPDLYEITLRLNGIDEDKHIRFGFRKIEIKSNHIYLNNHPICLKGISLREELISVGQNISILDRRKEIINIKTMGFNAIRTISPHDEATLNIADEEGLLIFEDIPLYTFSNFKSQRTNLLAANYIRNLIKRDYNHPSVIIWSIGSDLPVERLECRRLLKRLVNFAKKIDSTRLITYETNRYLIDPLRKNTNCDLSSVSLSLGKNYKFISKFNFILDMIYYSNRNFPLIISKFGIESKKGTKRAKKVYSETYQMLFISYILRILNAKPYISGWFLHTYRDFRSPNRLNKYQQGFDRNGLTEEVMKWDDKKLLGRLMNQIIDVKETPNRFSLVLANFFSYLLKPYELFTSLLKYFRKKNLVRPRSKYYSQNREN